MKILLTALFVMVSTGCVGSKPEELVGICSHPAVNGGMPFQLTDEHFSLNMTYLTHTRDDDTVITLTAPQCILMREPNKK